jgi:multidrug efflux pump subunit AcrA (membrane-fusion protein)
MQHSTFRKYFSLALSLAITACGLNGCGQAKLSEGAKQDTSVSSSEQKLPTVAVKRMKLDVQLQLPGELKAFQDVPIHAKVEGYISWIGVDRGSMVKKGQEMIKIFCPELNERSKEADAKVTAAEASFRQAQQSLNAEISKELEAQSKLEADSLTYKRLQIADQTPGAIAKNEVDLAMQAVASDKARVAAALASIEAAKALVATERSNVIAAQNVRQSVEDMVSYLTITAPFDGVITERNVHKGSIVAVSATREMSDLPLVRIRQTCVLRLVVAVPEDFVSGVSMGMKIPFTVPAYLGETFYGYVARPAYSLERNTRTMPVELNAFNANDAQQLNEALQLTSELKQVNPFNAGGRLEPGMFATVYWTATRPYNTLFVPSTAVTSDLKGTFVVTIKNDIAERLPVSRGQTMSNWVEVVGNLKEGDTVALEATDEIKTGTHVVAESASESDVEQAGVHGHAGGD